MEKAEQKALLSSEVSSDPVCIDVFAEVELELNIKIPSIIKNNFRINGYEDNMVIAQIKDEAISEMELFAQNDLKHILDNDKLENYYGIFAKNPEKFKFLSGHRQIIHMIISFCKNKLLPGTSSRCTAKSTKPVLNDMKNLESVCTDSKSSKLSETMGEVNLTDENALIHKNIKSWCRSKVADCNWASLSVKLDNIQVKTKVAGENLSCNLKCFCKADYTLPKISRKCNPLGSKRWILSNFYKHFLNKHLDSNVCKEASSSNKSSTSKHNTITSYLKPVDSSKQNPNIKVIQNIKISGPVTHKPQRELGKDVLKSTENQCKELMNQYDDTSCSTFIVKCGDKSEVAPNIPTFCSSSEFSIGPNLVQSPIVYSAPNSSLTSAATSNTIFCPTDDVLDSTTISNDLDFNQETVDLAVEIRSESDCDHSSDLQQMSKWQTLKYQRSERDRRSREKAIDNQTLITQYFAFTDLICNSVSDELAETMISAFDIVDTEYISEHSSTYENKKEYLSLFLRKLVSNAIGNLNTPDCKNEFDKFTKKMSIYLFYTAGRLTYETLYSNLKNSLSSISTLNRFLENNKAYVKEGDIDLTGLNHFLEQRNLPKFVWVSEDGTRIKGKIEYDPKSNQVVGFVLPLKNGLPQQNTFTACSSATIQKLFETGVKSTCAQVIVAQPLAVGSPSYCLGIFGTDNKFTFRDVQDRWKFMKIEAKKLGITILGFSSDGDTRMLKAMRLNSNLAPCPVPPVAACNAEGYTRDQNTWKWFHMKLSDTNECYFQDAIHILTKLRVRFLNENKKLIIGNKIASPEHLHELTNNISKDKHVLIKSDLKGEDKMNFGAAEKMCSSLVIEYLVGIEGSEGTVFYLTIMNCILSCFLDCKISLRDRLCKMLYVVFLLRIWRSEIKKSQDRTLTNNFLSTNCYTCIELNAHNLIKLILLFKFREIDDIDPSMFFLANMSSQPCESLFRMARSMTSTFSTVINFSIKDFTDRIGRIRTINNIISEIGSTFLFPREKKRLINSSSKVSITQNDLLKLDIEGTVLQALEDALKTANELGIKASEQDCLHMDLTSLPQLDDIEEEGDPCEAELEQSIANNVREDQTKEIDSALLEYNNKEVESLELKDYSHLFNNSTDEPYIEVHLKNKKTVVKKSSLIWMLDESDGHVSTDRLMRFVSNKRGPRKSRNSLSEQPTNKKKKNRITRTKAAAQVTAKWRAKTNP